MYRCGICTNVAPPRQSLLRHAVLRRDRSIAREVSVCAECAHHLDRGKTLEWVRKERGPEASAPMAPLEARLHLPVQVGTPTKLGTDWRDAGIRGALLGVDVGSRGQVTIKDRQHLRFLRTGINEWQFGVGLLARKMDILDATRYVKEQM